MILHRPTPTDPTPDPTREDWSLAAAAFGSVFAGRDFGDWETEAFIDALLDDGGVGE